jgi:hypothetical protein
LFNVFILSMDMLVHSVFSIWIIFHIGAYTRRLIKVYLNFTYFFWKKGISDSEDTVLNSVTEFFSLNLQVGFRKWQNSWSWSLSPTKAPKTMHKVSWTGMCMHLFIGLSIFFVLLIVVDIDYNIDLLLIFSKVIASSCFSNQLVIS